MYKKIVHNIVEEHYDKDRLVSCSYPESYRLSTTDSKCSNCVFATSGVFCTNWNLFVDPDYVCDYWTEIV